MKNQSQSSRVDSRHADLAHVLGFVKDARSCAIIGLSNVGKSWFLRTMCDPGIQDEYLGKRADEFIFVYIDCNLMLELTDQGFYEVVLRATRDVLARDGVAEPLVAQMESYYSGVV
jgi:hypothetical protein